MNDSGPRLDLLRFLERVQERDLARTRRWIAEEERRETERRRGEQRRPPVPDWVLQLGIGQGRPPVSVHTGDCHMAKGSRVKPITEDQARRALYEHVPACTHCNPDAILGVLD
ncbi:DUF6233 domain-containing protein [Streptomyces sp. NPDC048415]|uniref:DUF6233 domain-containing protein n=1 Tax=Streptomyces sp. NPDC048415 TaxID=3154822 RepID=UPI00342A1652